MDTAAKNIVILVSAITMIATAITNAITKSIDIVTIIIVMTDTTMMIVAPVVAITGHVIVIMMTEATVTTALRQAIQIAIIEIAAAIRTKIITIARISSIALVT
jgi:hypothetical protein